MTQTFFDPILVWVTSLWWLVAAAAHSCIYVAVGNFLLYGYREHTYLYVFDEKDRALANLIQVVARYTKRLKLPKYRAFITLHLRRAGYRLDIDDNFFIAQQLLFSIIAFVITYFLFVLLLGFPFAVVPAVVALGFAFPLIKLVEQSGIRFRSFQKDLPFFIDYLGLALGAGLDFNQGLRIVVRDAPDSPLKSEFSRILRNMQLGMSREEALTEMEQRLSSPSLRLFIQTLVQAMKMGSDVVTTLTALSESLQTKRFQQAEESAGKISVKMMLPMLIFVLPATMIILLGPMLIQWMQTL